MTRKESEQFLNLVKENFSRILDAWNDCGLEDDLWVIMRKDKSLFLDYRPKEKRINYRFPKTGVRFTDYTGKKMISIEYMPLHEDGSHILAEKKLPEDQWSWNFFEDLREVLERREVK